MHYMGHIPQLPNKEASRMHMNCQMNLTCCRSRKWPKACALPILKVACMALSSAASQLKPTTVMLGDLSQRCRSGNWGPRPAAEARHMRVGGDPSP